MNTSRRSTAPLAALLTLAAACSWPLGAHAVTVYRCGSAGNSFSDTPCPGAIAFEADDRRSAAQQAEAGRVAASDRQLAHDLQHARLQAAALQRPAAAGAIRFVPNWVAQAAEAEADATRRVEPKRHAKKSRRSPFIDDRAEFLAYATAPRKAAR